MRIRRMTAALAVGMVFLLATTMAFAAQPLPTKDKASIGAEYMHLVLDTDSGPLSGNSYGLTGSYDKKDIGIALHLGISGLNFKGSSDDFDSAIKGSSPAIKIEIDQRMVQLPDRFQIGAYLSYMRMFGSIKGAHSDSYDVYDANDNYLGTVPTYSSTKVSGLQETQIGLTLQKDFDCVHLYGGPMIQLIHGTREDAYLDSSDPSNPWNDSGSISQRSTLGWNAGAAVDFGKKFTAVAYGIFKEHNSVGVNLKYNF